MRQTILLADDSSTIQRLVTQTFADADFEIVSVSNGDAAIKKFEDIRPSVVLADIYMPGKNGYEVCTYVKNHPSRSATPVVLLVGAFDAFDEEVGKQAGAAASIIKPFEPRALVELVRSVLPQEGTEVQESRQDVRQEARPDVLDEVPAMTRHQSSTVPESITIPEPHPPASGAPPMGAEESDLLGLSSIFQEPQGFHAASTGISEEEIERIADRVIQRLSVQVIEDIAWDIVPDITEKIVREELKRIDES
jgi:CheY-like chemotaxis protein